ncbi:MAG: hypothetical protein KDC95_22065, partial [Planctomycetes bacterium]|nr:hypothetical protein [Planctomycetota bacterium]
LALDGDTLLASAYIQNKPPVAEGSVFVFDVQQRFHTWVHPMPLLSNDTAKFEMRHGTKGAPQLLFFGFSGSTHIPLPWPGTSIDILSPVLIAAAIADGNGGSKWEINVPTSALGVKLWVQGFEFPTTTSLDSTNYWYSEVQNGG